MIRWLVALLLLGNLLFSAFVLWGPGSRNARDEPRRLLELQLNAQQVRVLSGDRDRPASSGGFAPPDAAACLAWGPFAEPDATRARAALGDLVAADRISARAVTASASWWVYMPPQKSLAEAQRKAAELRALGVTGFTLLETEGEWQNAIELAVFSDEGGARNHLVRLQQAGVRSAAVGERRGGPGIEWLVREPAPEVMTRVLEIKQASFPDSPLGAIQCPQ